MRRNDQCFFDLPSRIAEAVKPLHGRSTRGRCRCQPGGEERTQRISSPNARYKVRRVCYQRVPSLQKVAEPDNGHCRVIDVMNQTESGEVFGGPTA